MLEPGYLEHLPTALVELYSLVEQDILCDMALRIAPFDDLIPAAQWQYKKLVEMGRCHDYIIKALSGLLGKTETEIKKIVSASGMETLKTDDEIYKRTGLNPSPLSASPALQAVLRSGVESTMGLFENLTHTTASTATKQFERALDRAWLQVQSGAFSHQESIKMAIKRLCEKGIESIEYPSGHRDSMDVAVRRATLTGVNQTALRLQEERADEMGCDLVEVTAHSGARTGIGVANHAGWQGEVYSRSGAHPKFPSLVDKTGYGTGRGLGGWNCRHGMYPFIEGVSTPTYTLEELDELNAPKYLYNGKMLTAYEASQRQRYIERQIRRWKRENLAMKAAGLDTGESASKLIKWQAAHKDFLQQTGFKPQNDRTQVIGWGRSQAQKANWDARKSAAGVANTGKTGIINIGKESSGPQGTFKVLDPTGYASLRKAAGKISKKDRATIWDHSNGYIQTGNSWNINKALRENKASSLPMASQNTINTLNNVISNNTANQDFMSVRYADRNYLNVCFGKNIVGLSAKDIVSELRRNRLGDVLEEKAFMSVSMDANKNVFAGKPVKLNVEIPEGTHIYASSNYQESEAILPTGVNYLLRDAQCLDGQIVLTVRVKQK